MLFAALIFYLCYNLLSLQNGLQRWTYLSSSNQRSVTRSKYYTTVINVNIFTVNILVKHHSESTGVINVVISSVPVEYSSEPVFTTAETWKWPSVKLMITTVLWFIMTKIELTCFSFTLMASSFMFIFYTVQAFFKNLLKVQCLRALHKVDTHSLKSVKLTTHWAFIYYM